MMTGINFLKNTLKVLTCISIYLSREYLNFIIYAMSFFFDATAILFLNIFLSPFFWQSCNSKTCSSYDFKTTEQWLDHSRFIFYSTITCNTLLSVCLFSLIFVLRIISPLLILCFALSPNDMLQ